MKVCKECQKYNIEIVEKLRKAGVKISKCSLKECEMGHPSFRPKLPNKLERNTDSLKEKTKHIKDSTWGWIYFYPSYGGVYYWWLYCSDLSQGYCSTARPSDTLTCDIHYEPWVWVYNLGAWFGGLVNFGGCRRARNCGGDCGEVNSKRNGVCLRRYSEAPEVFRDRWIWCLYENTGVLDCIYRIQYMVLNYIP